MHGHGWWSYIAYDPSKGKPQIDRQLVRRIFAYARPHLFAVTVVLVTIVAISLLELIPPLLYRDLIDNVLPNRNYTRLNWLALGMIGIPILSGAINVVQRFFSARAGEGIIFDLRQQMYTHLQQMALRFFTNTKAGEIMSRFNSDVVGAQNAITGTIPNIVTNSVTLVSTLVIMVSIEWRLAALALVVLPLFLLPARRVARTLRTIRREASEQNAEMSNIINETLTINGALLVKTFGRQSRELTRFRRANGAVRDIGIRRARVGQLFFMGMSIAGTLGAALIYWVGGHLVLSGAISTGTIVAFVAYLSRLYGPISSLANVQVEFATSMVSFERVFEYLDLPLEITDRPNATKLKQVEGHVRFEQVSFRYGTSRFGSTVADKPRSAITNENARNGAQPTAPEATKGQAQSNGSHNGASPGAVIQPTGNDDANAGESTVTQRTHALHDVSFEMKPGQLVALVGPSGAGKTTITYLLPRLYDPTSGRITLDGLDLRDVALETLAQQIGMVTQETYLFHDTIRANLLYARPDATDSELETACRAANIHDFIVSLPEGYESIVGERGYRLSGGEKQRLAIARVILKDPRILVLDEATSHLDSQSEALIQAALAPLFAGRTSLVIAHRLSTILAADKILVLDQGQVVEEGNHATLLAQGGLYAHLYETQFMATGEMAEI
ncbi:MAG TPA: ABC transporter ATP-binding protein [Caldilineaceae bacterium]|nr:ABC transporter ATP-binding protein [Caldilineaceae bacterium]